MVNLSAHGIWQEENRRANSVLGLKLWGGTMHPPIRALMEAGEIRSVPNVAEGCV